MLKLGSTYLIVKNMDKSIKFYSDLLEMEPTAQNENRWAQFDFDGKCIALWNPEYDNQRMKNEENLEGVYSDSYIEYQQTFDLRYGNNFVLNFYVDDLKEEYKRVEKLAIGDMTPIMFMNVGSPYHLFVVNDPDGNQIEITGNI